ncbi:MAG: hypothetical protein JNK21_14615 [Rhodospirillaceae bacterium]|nr:hypothetical protein [Rhodospirillaceae bacterium]
MKRISIWLASAVTSLALLASCWLPEQFETEIRFTSTGLYGVTYIGVITYAPLFGKIARGQISKEDVDRQIQQYLKFLKGDSAFKEINSIGNGRFQVRYEKEGQFAGNKQSFNFISRQGAMFRLRTTEDAKMILAGSGQALLYADRFEEVGLKMSGLIRVVTDAEVLEHNANFVRQSPTPGFTQYDWRIRNLRDPPPRLIAKLKVDPRTGVPAFGAGASGVDTDDGKE